MRNMKNFSIFPYGGEEEWSFPNLVVGNLKKFIKWRHNYFVQNFVALAWCGSECKAW